MKQKKPWLILIVTALCVGGMLVVDGLWKPGYFVKSMTKIVLFFLVPLTLAFHTLDWKGLFLPKRRGLLLALGLGIGVYAMILGGYFLLRPFVDFSGIAGSLSRNVGVTRENFIWVSLYISFVNSLLEEFFFRGFCFWGLKKAMGVRFAHGVSASAFALYHTAMMAGWFDWWVFLLAISGLFVGGLLFNWLNQKQQNLYTSWLTHMFANFAINTIGFILLSVY